MENQAKGIPIARAAEVNIRNNHMQYIVTWYEPFSLVSRFGLTYGIRYGLSAATAVMFYLLVKRPPPSIAKRVRQSGEW